MLTSFYNFLSVCVIGVIGWAFHTSSRISILEQAHKDLKEYLKDLITARFDAQDDRFARIEHVLNGRLTKE